MGRSLITIKKNFSWKIPLLDSEVQMLDSNEVELKEAECGDICKNIHS